MSERNAPPLATYRLQFNRQFRLSNAQALAVYFGRLGVTHIYASPILRARAASTHGYDVTDPMAVDPKLGDVTELAQLHTALKNLGLGIVLDIVPNHMAANMENPYWRDVLTYGPSSPFARWFDIDWRISDPELWGRVLAPVLGNPLGKILDQGELQIAWSNGRFELRYFDHAFPVDPAAIPMLCRFDRERLREALPADSEALREMDRLLAKLAKLPSFAARLRKRNRIDREEVEQWLAQFAQLVVQSPRVQQWAEELGPRFGEGSEGIARLTKFVSLQPYRLAHWRDAARAVNYRRFFDINDLVSLRQEDPQVYAETHATIFRWIEEGWIDGLRIDHVDGLRDPRQYLIRLHETLRAGQRRPQPPVYVEKILAADEHLPQDWPVQGTTGYEFLNQVEALFIAPAGFARIDRYYRRLQGGRAAFRDYANGGKRRVLRHDLSSYVGQLVALAQRLLEERARGKEALLAGDAASLDEGRSSATALSESAVATLAPAKLSKRDMTQAIIETIVALPVYRTYIHPDDGSYSAPDKTYLQNALAAARASGRVSSAALDALANCLLLTDSEYGSDAQLRARVHFVERFQQLTGPVAAKGIEDTALYAYTPLVSLNEVGGEPVLHANAVEQLHRANEARRRAWPDSMLCVTTHDTKRTADVRARLDVLSEVPERWIGQVKRWMRAHRGARKQLRNKPAPDAAAEWLCYQTLLGIWPAPENDALDELPNRETLQSLRERTTAYLLKAAREAKTRTSWTQPNAEYERAIERFVASLFGGEGESPSPFLSEMQCMAGLVARPGFWNGLARTLIQYASPGAPDLYQGDELWNFTLVDPDNRRPVDYALRESLLNEVVTRMEGSDDERRAYLAEMLASAEDGRIKLHVIRSALLARRRHAELFARGEYVPLAAAGERAEHVFAFARRTETAAAIVVAPRLTTQIVDNPRQLPIGGNVWGNTRLTIPFSPSNKTWHSVLTHRSLAAANGELMLSEALDALPVELLLAQ